MKTNDISVVIPTINNDFNIESVLSEQLLKNLNLEIIIVKQVKRDVDLVSFNEVNSFGSKIKTIIINDFGTSNARNIGAKNATGSIIVFLDDDVRPCNMYFKSLCEVYKNDSVDMAFGAYRYVSAIDIEKDSSLYDTDALFNFTSVHKASAATGAGSAISVRARSLVQSNIYFDTRLGGGCEIICGEDSVFCLSYFRAGLGVYSTSSFVVLHPDDGSTMHVRSKTYYKSLWSVLRSFYGIRGLYLGVKFSMRLLIKEKNAKEFSSYIACLFRSKKLN